MMMNMMYGPTFTIDATNGDWDKMADLMAEMMTPYRAGGGLVFWQLHWVLELVTWILLIALLAAAVRWLWKKGGK